MKSFDIAAYTFNAEMLCPGCTRSAAAASITDYPAAVAVYEAVPTEEVLNLWALMVGIDRDDERTFDSDEFPKVVFVDGVADGETCDRCGGEIL